MKKLLTFVIATIIGASTIFAQGFEGEIQAGMNVSNITKYDSKIGFHIGLRGILPIQSLNGTYINGGILLTLKGAQLDYGYELDANCDAYYIEVPIHFGYKHVISENIAIFGEFGPYFAYGIFGKFKVSSEGESLKVNTFSNVGGVKHFDWGLGFRAGIEINQKVPISFGYDFGLIDINKYDDVAPNLKNSNFTVAIGYKF